VALALILSGSIEGTLFTWLPYFATQFVLEPNANLILSGFLVTYIPARAVYSVIVQRVDSLLLVAVLAVDRSVTVRRIHHIFDAGDGRGGITGGCVRLRYLPHALCVRRRYQPSYSGPVNAIATGASYLGLSIAPAVIGVIATWYDIGTALSLLTVVVGVLAVIVATLRFKLGPSGVV